MRKLVMASLLVAMGTQAGCFGPFRLTQKVWAFNDGLSDDIVVKEVAFIVMVAVPVYGVAAIGDALIFNLVEFATGDNPISDTRTIDADGARVAFTRTEKGIDVVLTRDGEEQVRRFRRRHGSWEVVDARGQRVALLRHGADGSVEVVGPANEPLASWTSAQIDHLVATAWVGGWERALAEARHASGGPMFDGVAAP